MIARIGARVAEGKAVILLTITAAMRASRKICMKISARNRLKADDRSSKLKLTRGKTAYAVIKTTTTQTVASARRRCRRCPGRTEFVSRRDLRYLLRQARFGHNLANALDEGCGAERLLPQDHLNSGIQPRMILDRKVARGDDNDRDLVPDRMLLHLCYELKSIHLWHHQIENDDVRNAFPEPVEGE